VAAFGLFFLAERVFNLDQGHAQTLMYLKLSVAGHLTIFLTRTRGRFWTIRPARVLLLAVFGTQTVATLIAVFGIFMTPLGWGWALFVWVYAIAWFLVNDQVKVLAYRILDPAGAKAKPKADAAAEPKPEADAAAEPKATAKPAAAPKAEPKADAAAEPKPEPTATAEPAAAAEAKPKVHAAAEPKADAAAEPKHKAEAAAEPTATAKPTAAAKADIKPGPRPKAAAEPEPKPKTPSDLTPQLVKRVHEMYEDLGREEVQAVQDWEKADREVPKAEPDE
jgi:H+-transporting ATPase